MFKLLLIAISLLFSSFAAAAPLSLVQNEYVFAQAAASHGVRDGFLMYLDKQAITLAPQPVNAYETYTNRKPSGIKLSWYPVFAVLSASGDFGVDTGPWRADWTEGGKAQQSHGDWLTVWHRNKQGQWRILFDGGVDHAVPAKPSEALAKNAKVDKLPAVKSVPAMDQIHWTLQRAESVFSDTAGDSSPRAAYSGQAADDLRLLQEGSESLVGKAAVVQSMPMQHAGVQWVPSGGSVAASGDLGYIYGMTYKAKDDAHKTPQGSYAHVWRLDHGEWRLLMDLELPVPPQPQ